MILPCMMQIPLLSQVHFSAKFLMSTVGVKKGGYRLIACGVFLGSKCGVPHANDSRHIFEGPG
jgi:hypothetical protein